ncbi:MAG TPA: anti-sigma factor [Thermoleophilaceae bacterium]
MSAVDHERYAQDVGAYLLGALPELEAQVFERHLMGCGDCRDELERLRLAAEALPRSVEAFEPPPSLKRSLMEVVEAEARERRPAAAPAPPARRRSRFALPGLGALRPRQLAWAAAALVLLGGAVGFGVDRLARGGSSTRVLSAQVSPAALPGGSARLETDADGARATLHVEGLRVLRGDRVYEVWVERGGSIRPAGALFSVAADGSGAAAVPLGVKGADAVLVTREPAGGSERPSEAPIIRVRT